MRTVAIVTRMSEWNCIKIIILRFKLWRKWKIIIFFILSHVRHFYHVSIHELYMYNEQYSVYISWHITPTNVCVCCFLFSFSFLFACFFSTIDHNKRKCNHTCGLLISVEDFSQNYLQKAPKVIPCNKKIQDLVWS